jgi:hypothetical protein
MEIKLLQKSEILFAIQDIIEDFEVLVENPEMVKDKDKMSREGLKIFSDRCPMSIYWTLFVNNKTWPPKKERTPYRLRMRLYFWRYLYISIEKFKGRVIHPYSFKYLIETSDRQVYEAFKEEEVSY